MQADQQSEKGVTIFRRAIDRDLQEEVKPLLHNGGWEVSIQASEHFWFLALTLSGQLKQL